MTVFRKIFFVLCFVACVVSLIALSYFSVFSAYSGNDGEFPSLYGVLVTGNGGLVKAFSNYLFNSLPHTEGAFGILSQTVFGVLLIVFLASPLLLISSIGLVIYYFVKALDFKITGNMPLALMTAFIISSQLLHTFLLCNGLTQSYFSNARFVCVIAAMVSAVLMSEIAPQAKYELKISLFNKAFKISTLVFALYLLNQILQSCSQNTFAWSGLFAILATVLVAHTVFSGLYVLTRYSMFISLANAILVSGVFITLKVLNGGNLLLLIPPILIPIAMWIILAIAYVYFYNKLCIIYCEPIEIERKMSGFGNNRDVKPRNVKAVPFDWSSLLYPLKVLFGIAIVAVSMLLSNFLLKLIISLVIKSEEWIILLSNAGSVVFSGYVIYSLFDGYSNLPFGWEYMPECDYIEAWKFKNATACLIFSNIVFLIILVPFACPLVLLEMEWWPNIEDAQWTYLLLLIIGFIISRMILVYVGVYESTCPRCHHLETFREVSSWRSGKSLQRHKKKVDGHYVTDSSTSTSTYQTTTRGSSDIHIRGYGQIGYTIGSSTSTTNGSTHTTTQRWVDGYEVDEGLYEHQTRYAKNRCACCGYTYTSSTECSRLVG